MAWIKRLCVACCFAGSLAFVAAPALALDSFVFEAPGADAALMKVLSGASLTGQAMRDRRTRSQDVFAAARADYARLLGALYAQGHYSGVIRISIDGREAASIAPLDAPASVTAVSIRITPGPRFAFSRTSVVPLATGTVLPEGFAEGAPALSGEIVAATGAAIEAWRDIGHAKAAVATQSITADHRSAQLAAEVTLAPGPRLRFGTLSLAGYSRMDPRRLAEIAGFPSGKVFSPAALAEVRARLRRSGVFSAVSLTEAETPRANGTLDVALLVAEEKPRRFGFGGDISTLEGLSVSGYWLHRNLLGGGERLRLEAAISGIGIGTGGPDYTLGARLDRPATMTPDTSAFVLANLARLQEADFSSSMLRLGFGLSHYFSDRLTGEAAVSYSVSQVTDTFETLQFRAMAVPVSLTWDNRDKPLNATQGFYLDADVTPFLGFGSTGSGVQIKTEARAYRALGARMVLAGRAQIGFVQGSGLAETPREYLFYSGGGGTVRGQPYQSLGVNVLRAGNSVPMGGASFAAFSGELRTSITTNIGLVGFYDVGFVSAEAGFGGGAWHSGAGFGLRYDTGIGPIRLDVAVPVSGGTGRGVQLYLGIGQAF